MVQHIQTILFPKDKFSIHEAVEWLNAHHYHSHKIDEGEHYYRFRQRQPIHGGHYRTHTLPNGIEIVIHYSGYV